jgi:hypothetical protein
MRRHLEACGGNRREQWLVGHVRVAVRENWPAILRVAAALHERGTLSDAEIATLMD